MQLTTNDSKSLTEFTLTFNVKEAALLSGVIIKGYMGEHVSSLLGIAAMAAGMMAEDTESQDKFDELVDSLTKASNGNKELQLALELYSSAFKRRKQLQDIA